jgi:hypothetical protein
MVQYQPWHTRDACLVFGSRAAEAGSCRRAAQTSQATDTDGSCTCTALAHGSMCVSAMRPCRLRSRSVYCSTCVHCVPYRDTYVLCAGLAYIFLGYPLFYLAQLAITLRGERVFRSCRILSCRLVRRGQDFWVAWESQCKKSKSARPCWQWQAKTWSASRQELRTSPQIRVGFAYMDTELRNRKRKKSMSVGLHVSISQRGQDLGDDGRRFFFYF